MRIHFSTDDLMRLGALPSAVVCNPTQAPPRVGSAISLSVNMLSSVQSIARRARDNYPPGLEFRVGEGLPPQ